MIMGQGKKSGGLIPSAIASSTPKPGSIVRLPDGKRYQVASDGDTLMEIK
jgi:hypothetical protein